MESRHKKCPRCTRTLDVSAFCKNRAKRDGLADYCKECHYTRNSNEAKMRRRGLIVQKIQRPKAPPKKRIYVYKPRPRKPRFCVTCNSQIPFKSRYCREAGCPNSSQQRRKEFTRLSAARSRARQIHKTFNLTPDWIQERLKKQDATCAICALPFESGRGRFSMVIDHDHTTGKVRGLLHRLCNTGLGIFSDSPDILVAAANYLQVSRDTPEENSSSGGINSNECYSLVRGE